MREKTFANFALLCLSTVGGTIKQYTKVFSAKSYSRKFSPSKYSGYTVYTSTSGPSEIGTWYILVRPLYKGHCSRTQYNVWLLQYIENLYKRTTPLQATNNSMYTLLSPMCPLFGGSNVYKYVHEHVYYNYCHYTMYYVYIPYI